MITGWCRWKGKKANVCVGLSAEIRFDAIDRLHHTRMRHTNDAKRLAFFFRLHVHRHISKTRVLG